tara:strand:- start:11062 stop:12327 length:1266 start_codon:yes stop_codon:yes gene_type:complete
MKNTRQNKNLINEISDMRVMMRTLNNRNHQPINEQLDPGGAGCNILNGGCPQDCTCVEVTAGYGNSSFGWDGGIDCCCGNELVTIDGCQPGPCNSNSDCNNGSGYSSGQDCCYANSAMQQLGITSCNAPSDCHDYPAGTNTNQNTGTVSGCLDPLATNYNSGANVDSQQCCYQSNSGCMMQGLVNYDPSNDCDCAGNWPLVGAGNINCCLVSTDTGSGGLGNSGSSGGFTTIGSLGWGSNCFIDGSMVLMSNGEEKNISEVKIDEEVKSEFGVSKVIGIDIHKGEFEIYSFNGGKPFTTAEHPFKTLEGWKALNPVESIKIHGVETNVLKEGDTLVRIDGENKLKEINKDEEIHNLVYNLKLDNEHVYYVNGYLVHNAKTGMGGTGSAGGRGDRDNIDIVTGGIEIDPRDPSLNQKKRKQK